MIAPVSELIDKPHINYHTCGYQLLSSEKQLVSGAEF
jgi:hypothetical protein